jgi:hypothetical protein
MNVAKASSVRNGIMKQSINIAATRSNMRQAMASPVVMILGTPGRTKFNSGLDSDKLVAGEKPTRLESLDA